MYNLEAIQRFIENKICGEITEVTPDSDIHNDLGCTGDDFDELIQAYSIKFNVNMDTYLWYFHTDEEGQNFGGSFFKPPYERVEHIPETPNMLLEFANIGYWDIKYPEHKFPKRRYDTLINQVFLGLLIVYFIYRCTGW